MSTNHHGTHRFDHLVETRTASVTQAAYTLTKGVRSVDLASTGAGGPFAVDLGTTNEVNHEVTLFVSAWNMSSFTVDTIEGTTTLDSVNESLTVFYTAAGWRVKNYWGTTGPV